MPIIISVSEKGAAGNASELIEVQRHGPELVAGSASTAEVAGQ